MTEGQPGAGLEALRHLAVTRAHRQERGHGADPHEEEDGHADGHVQGRVGEPEDEQQQREDGQLRHRVQRREQRFEGGPDPAGGAEGDAGGHAGHHAHGAADEHPGQAGPEVVEQLAALDELQSCLPDLGGRREEQRVDRAAGRGHLPHHEQQHRRTEAQHDLDHPAAAPATAARSGVADASRRTSRPFAGGFCRVWVMTPPFLLAREAWTSSRSTSHTFWCSSANSRRAAHVAGAGPPERHRDVTDHPAGPGRHDDDAVAEDERLLEAVGDEDDGAPVRLPDLEQHLLQHHPHLRVHGRERLVHEQDLRLTARARAIDTRCRMPPDSVAGYAFSKPPGRAGGSIPSPARWPPAAAPSPCPDRTARWPARSSRAAPRSPGRPWTVAAWPSSSQRSRVPAVGGQQAVDDAQERRLAAAGRADQADELAVGHPRSSGPRACTRLLPEMNCRSTPDASSLAPAGAVGGAAVACRVCVSTVLQVYSRRLVLRSGVLWRCGSAEPLACVDVERLPGHAGGRRASRRRRPRRPPPGRVTNRPRQVASCSAVAGPGRRWCPVGCRRRRRTPRGCPTRCSRARRR